MYYAAERGYTECIKELLKAGGAVDLPNAYDKDSPLMAACSRGHVNAVQVILFGLLITYDLRHWRFSIERSITPIICFMNPEKAGSPDATLEIKMLMFLLPVDTH